MKRLLGLVLRLYPEDDDGILREEMAETVMDGYRNAASPAGFAVRELWSLLREGIGSRLGRWWKRARRARRPGAEPMRGWKGRAPAPPGRRVGSLSTLGDDVRLAFKTIRKSLGFSLTVVLTLAVGIGATVAMFTILEAALLRTLPYPEAEALVMGRATFRGEMNMTCSFPDYLSHKEGTDAFEALAAVYPNLQRYTLTGGDVPERVGTQWVTSDFFDALGVEPALGRTFSPEEGEPNGPRVAVLSHGLWQRWFGGGPEVVGEVLTVAGIQVTVVGVMPAAFRFMNDTDLWAPVKMGMFDTEGRRSHSWVAVGRLRDGMSLAQAQAQLDVVSAQLAEAYPDSHTDKGFGLVPLGEGLAEDYRPGILLLMGATTLLLLISCGNVAGLLTARATARRTELSVRAALGASRRVLFRQLLVESTLLALLAGVAGSVLALWIQRVTLAAVPLDLLGVRALGPSRTMLAFALVLSLGTALLFGTGPAVGASRAEPAEEMKAGRTTTGERGGGRIRGSLVVTQVALSVVLLTGSGLLIRSLANLRAVDLGFRTGELITAYVALNPGEGGDPGSRTRFFAGVLEDVETLPGVVSASFVDKVPIRDRWTNWFVWPSEDPPEGQENGLSTYSRTVMPGYFETLGIPFLRGRDHEMEDARRNPSYLVINQAAATALFAEENPIGRRITVFNGMGNAEHEILGVVPDFRITSVDRAPSPQMYYLHAARPQLGMNLVVRTRGDPGTLVSAIRRVVLARDPDVPLERVTPMDEVVTGSLSPNRLLGTATTLFAVTALFLSLTGLYAVLAFYVGRRTREIGIRVAFGATRSHVSGLVLWRGIGMVGGGLALGLLGAGAASRVLRSQLYQVGPLDPATFVSVAAGFLLVGVLAAALPAAKATRVDPVRAIQVE